ncbi:hypothetical protein [Azospirillum endophyticum]
MRSGVGMKSPSPAPGEGGDPRHRRGEGEGLAKHPEPHGFVPHPSPFPCSAWAPRSLASLATAFHLRLRCSRPAYGRRLHALSRDGRGNISLRHRKHHP